MRIWILAIAAVLSATPTIANAEIEAILSEGKSDYLTYCAVCHGRDAKGDGPLAKELVTAPSDLTVLARNAGGTLDEARLQRIIDGRKDIASHGPRDMPIWGRWFKYVARTEDPETADNETTEIIVNLRIQGLIDYLDTLQDK